MERENVSQNQQGHVMLEGEGLGTHPFESTQIRRSASPPDTSSLPRSAAPPGGAGRRRSATPPDLALEASELNQQSEQGRSNSNPTPSTNPVQTPLEHFRIELKAWIPHPKVVDPEEPIRAPGVLETMTDLTAAVIPNLDIGANYDYHSYFRGDDHTPYEGSYRVLSVVEFDWDGTNIVNFSHNGSYGASHRDYDWIFEWENLIYPDLEIASGSGTESGTATSATNGTQSGNSNFSLSMDSAIPLTLFPAPAINSDLEGSLSGRSLTLSYNTDHFPSHGIKVYHNGNPLRTQIVNDVASQTVLGPIGAGVITQGLLRQSNRGSISINF